MVIINIANINGFDGLIFLTTKKFPEQLKAVVLAESSTLHF